MRNSRRNFIGLSLLFVISLLISSINSATGVPQNPGWGLCFLGRHIYPGNADIPFAYRVGAVPGGSLRAARRSLDIWSKGRWKELGNVSWQGVDAPPFPIDRLDRGPVDRKSPVGKAVPANRVSRLRENTLTLQLLRLAKLKPGRYRVRIGDYRDFNVPTVAAEFQVESAGSPNSSFAQLSRAFLLGGAGGTVASANPTAVGTNGGQLFLPDVKQDTSIRFTSYAAPDTNSWTRFDLALPPTPLNSGVLGVIVPALPTGVYQIEIANPEITTSNTPARTTTVALFVNDTCKSDVQPTDPID